MDGCPPGAYALSSIALNRSRTTDHLLLFSYINNRIDDLYNDCLTGETEISRLTGELATARAEKQAVLERLEAILRATPGSVSDVTGALDTEIQDPQIGSDLIELVSRISPQSDAAEPTSPGIGPEEMESIEHSPIDLRSLSEDFDRVKARIAELESRIDYQGGHPFGSVDKPIERFLHNSGEISQRVLSICIARYLQGISKEVTTCSSDLPCWFNDGFEEWKRDYLERWLSRESRGGMGQQNPYLFFNHKKRGVFLHLPQQRLTTDAHTPFATLLFWDDQESLITDLTIPLNKYGGSIFIDEVEFEVERPSRQYHLELSTPTDTRSWEIEGLQHDFEIIAFDDRTGRLINPTREPADRFILVLERGKVCIPESNLVESGCLFGDWRDYYTYTIDPVAGEPLPITAMLGLAESSGEPIHTVFPETDTWSFDPFLRLDGYQTILGGVPDLRIIFDDIETLRRTEISLYPGSASSLKQPIFYRLIDIEGLISIDLEQHVCSVPLSKAKFLGKAPWGIFTCRIKNTVSRSDSRFSFAIFPHFTYRVPHEVYLPSSITSVDPYRVDLVHSEKYRVSPDPSVAIKRTYNGCVLRSSNPTIKASLEYAVPRLPRFTGQMLIQIPHLSWRFEGYADLKASSMLYQTSVIEERQLDRYGRNLNLAVYFPPHYSGSARLAESTGLRVKETSVVHGKAIFSFDGFKDTILHATTDLISFDLTLLADGIPQWSEQLFSIRRWQVNLRTKPEYTTSETGERTLSFTLDENVPGHDRHVTVWRYVAPERPPEMIVDTSIPDGETAIVLRQLPPFAPGIFYLQLTQRGDPWAIQFATFAGEKDHNTFQFSIELKGQDLLEQGDEAFERYHYAQSIACYKQCQILDPALGDFWRFKVLQRLVYPKRYEGAVEVFEQAMTGHVLSEADISFMIFQLIGMLHEVMKRSDDERGDVPLAIVAIFETVAGMSDRTAKMILWEHLPRLRHAIDLCSDLIQTERFALLSKLAALEEKMVERRQPIRRPYTSKPSGAKGGRRFPSSR